MIISGDYKPAATLNMLKKDLDLLLSQALAQQTPLPVNSMIRGIYAAASDKGLGEKDFFVLVQEAEKS
jgi:3-hydroxyisobutyrate dehydrogenase-like beta-hydroxyacid dehydrogenase